MKKQTLLGRYSSLCICLLALWCLGFTSLNSQTKYVMNCNSALLIESENVALSQIGVTELSNRNDGKEIEKYESAVGIPKYSAYCYAAQYWSFKNACLKLKMNYDSIPIPKSGLANSCFNFAIKNGIKKAYLPTKNSFIIWRAPNKINGHIERIYLIGKSGWVTTIAFNTSDKSSGKQGVFFKKRNIYHQLGILTIRGMVGFND